MNNKDIEIKVSVLNVIYEATLPIFYRLNSLLEDVITKTIKISETDKAVLLDYTSCAVTLKVLFEKYLEEAGPEQEKIILPYQEYVTIMSLSKAVELSTRTVLGGISIQEH